jgi:hypothetical protein
VAGVCRRLSNEERHNLYASPNIIRVIKSIRMRRAEHVARRERCETYTKFWVENLNTRKTWV